MVKQKRFAILYILAALTTIGVTAADAQPQLLWATEIGGRASPVPLNASDQQLSILSDGSILIVENFQDTSAVEKYNSDGKLEFRFLLPSLKNIMAVTEVPGSRQILALGGSRGWNVDSGPAQIVATDSSGKFLWELSVLSSTDSLANGPSSASTSQIFNRFGFVSDSIIVVTGLVDFSIPRVFSMEKSHAAKISLADRQIVWIKMLEKVENWDVAVFLKPLESGGYLQLFSQEGGPRNGPFVSAISERGYIVSRSNIESSIANFSPEIAVSSGDDNLILMDSRRNAMKVSPTGTVLWEKEFDKLAEGGYDPRVSGLAETSTGGVVVLEEYDSQFYFTTLDSTGALVSTEPANWGAFEDVEGFRLVDDHTAFVLIEQETDVSYYLAKYDLSGVPTSIALPAKTSAEIILDQSYPNPFRDHMRISFSISRRQMVMLDCVDVLGRVVHSTVPSMYEMGTHEIEWSFEGYSPGTYFYRLIAGNRTLSKRAIMVK